MQLVNVLVVVGTACLVKNVFLWHNNDENDVVSAIMYNSRVGMNLDSFIKFSKLASNSKLIWFFP